MLSSHISNTPLAVLEWDRDFRLVRWSPQAENIFGWSSDEILGIPLATVTTTEEFLSTLADFSGTRDVVFVDTTGRNPRDLDYISGLAELCKTTVPLELHLLMSANTDDECMIEAYRSYRNLPIEYIAFTKIDEAVRYGALYNLLLTYQKPVAYLTTGQRVPGDIEYATVNRLASLIVNKECHA